VQRLKSLSYRLVESLEESYRLESGSDTLAWGERIERLCEAILLRSELAFDAIPPPRKGIMNRACHLRQWLAIDGHGIGITDKAAYRKAYRPTLLALTLESIGRFDFVVDLDDAERADLLASLERIVFQVPDPLPLGHRRATIRVGEWINLRERLDAYRVNRNAEVNRVLDELRRSVRHNLTSATPWELNAITSLSVQSKERRSRLARILHKQS
jgi:hypothetical protein